MHTFLVSAISVLVVLGIMVIVHELGHFVAAKLCGVRVEQFSVGFPPRLFGFRIGETDYCISAIPLGGYVKMTGESMPGENMSLQGGGAEAAEAQKADPGALTSHPRWQRMIIGVAGPCANFILAIVLMTVIYMLHNQVPLFVEQPTNVDWVTPGSAAAKAGIQPGDRIVNFDGNANPSWKTLNERSAMNLNRTVALVVDRDGQQIPLSLALDDPSKGRDFDMDKVGILPREQNDPMKVSAVSNGMPAANAGLKPGDTIVSVDGYVFHGIHSMLAYLQYKNCSPLSVKVGRDGQTLSYTIQPVLMDVPKEGKAWRIGFSGTAPPSRVEQMALLPAIKASLVFNRENSLMILEVVNRLFSRKMSVDTLSGPIGIAQQTGQAWAAQNWEVMIELMTVISLNLGVLNLLPFPILDGGMILFLIIESIIRRDVNIVFKERVYQVAFVLIIFFFGFIMFNDIMKLRQPPPAAAQIAPCVKS